MFAQPDPNGNERHWLCMGSSIFLSVIATASNSFVAVSSLMNATAWPDLAGAQRNGCPSGSRNLRLLRLLWLHALLLLIGLELGLR